MGHHEMIMLQRKFNKSPLGCLFRCGKKWLKIFMPVIVVLGIGMAVMMTSEIDPQITGKFFSKKKSFFFGDLSVLETLLLRLFFYTSFPFLIVFFLETTFQIDSNKCLTFFLLF